MASQDEGNSYCQEKPLFHKLSSKRLENHLRGQHAIRLNLLSSSHASAVWAMITAVRGTLQTC